LLINTKKNTINCDIQQHEALPIDDSSGRSYVHRTSQGQKRLYALDDLMEGGMYKEMKKLAADRKRWKWSHHTCGISAEFTEISKTDKTFFDIPELTLCRI